MVHPIIPAHLFFPCHRRDFVTQARVQGSMVGNCLEAASTSRKCGGEGLKSIDHSVMGMTFSLQEVCETKLLQQ